MRRSHREECADGRFERIVRLAAEGIWTVDEDGLTDFINEQGAAMLGYTPEEMLGRPLTDFVFPEDKELLERTPDLIRSGESGRFEVRMPRKDGSEVWLLVSTSPIIGNDGRFHGALSMATDISERKHVEDAIHESEARYRQLFENIQEGVSLRRIVRNDRGEIVDVILIDANPAALRVYDAATVDELKGKLYGAMATPGMVAAALAMIKKMMATGESITAEQFSEVNGRYYLVTTTPLDHDQFLTLSVDITDRKKVEEALERRSDELARSNEDLKQFAYIASHDLKQPLANITSYLELLTERYTGKVLDDKALTFVDYALTSSEHMAEMIDSLLQFSRVTQNSEQFKRTDMNDVLDQVKESLATCIAESDAVVTHDLLPIVTAAPQQMGQVLQNLISNAVKFRGSRRPEVHVSAKREKGVWQFSVRDNGIGVDEKDRGKLFKMFSRLHDQQDYEGTGIGLALVKRIVERHGGEVWLESQPGKGSTFYFTIPSR